MKQSKAPLMIQKTLQTYLPFARAGVSILRARLSGQAFPWFVHFHVTGRCNLSCPYCYARYQKDQIRVPELSKVKAAIDELWELGTRYLSIQGGEPLLRPDLGQVVDHALQRGMLVGVVTNGVFMHRHLETLKRVHSLKISLDGAREHHDAIRGAGTYDKILRNLELARAAGLRELSFDATVSTATSSSWEHVLELAAGMGGSVFLAEISPQAGEKLGAADLTVEEQRQVWRRALELKRAGAPLENSQESIQNMLRHVGDVDPFEVFHDDDPIPAPLQDFVRTHRCPYGTYGVFLDCNGVFYACPRYFGVKGFEAQGGSLAAAYQRMLAANDCRFCRTLLNCQVGYLFYSGSARTLLQMARVGARYTRRR